MDAVNIFWWKCQTLTVAERQSFTLISFMNVLPQVNSRKLIKGFNVHPSQRHVCWKSEILQSCEELFEVQDGWGCLELNFLKLFCVQTSSCEEKMAQTNKISHPSHVVCTFIYLKFNLTNNWMFGFYCHCTRTFTRLCALPLSRSN